MRKVIVITGGARGIGKKLVENFAQSGNIVAFSYLNSEESALNMYNQLTKNGCEVYCQKANISENEQVESFIKNVIEKFGKIDVLINNAATTNDSMFYEKTSESFLNVLKTNLVGTFNISKYVGEIMYKQKSGKIINISSTNGIDTYFPMCLEYDASKAGVNSLTHNLAMQFAPYVIVNAVAPGFIATESELKGMDAEFIKMEEEKILLKRAGTEQDVYYLIEFLVSDKSNFINNQVIKINGGFYGD